MASLHRYANHFANAVTKDALAGVKALIAHGIGSENALFLPQDVFHDRAANFHLSQRIDILAPARICRLELAGVAVAQHDAASVGFDGLEDQIHDPFKELIDIK